MRTVIQVGLHKTAEWSYLVKDNWQEEMLTMRPQYHLPDYLKEDPTPFRYFGIDTSPSSVLETRRQYGNLPNTHFLTCGISDKFAIHKFHNKYYDPDNPHCQWNEYLPEQENMSFPFMPFNFIVEELGIDHITVLGADIDGHEDEMFANLMDWKVRPEIITVEFGFNHNRLTDSMLINCGYIPIKSSPTDADVDVEKIEDEGLRYVIKHINDIMFMRSDVFQQYQHTLTLEFSARTR